jgi:23S rRNA (uracil1939-C5)-methyltransferase
MNKEQIKVKCIGMNEDGKGIVRIKGQEVFVSNLIEGETATVEVIQSKKFMSTKVLRIEEKSKDRVQPKCPYFLECGGCQLQHLSYKGQIAFKHKNIVKLMGHRCKVNDVLQMKEPYYYRNKVHSTLACDKNNKIISGIYKEYTHDVISIDRCIIQDEKADEIIGSIREIMKTCKQKPYEEDTGRGFIRHILIKRGFASKQIMVVLVVASNVFPGKNNFIAALLKKHPEITTIVMNVNNSKTSVVLGSVEKALFGKGYIEDTLCDCVFQISPKSFYQINPTQTEVLYKKAIDMADLSGKETILDAYCGIGTISLIASKKAKKVIGVELNKDAVRDAIKNAKLNKISNTFFYNDDAGNFMVGLAEEKQSVDVVFMDPPRSGSDEKFLSALIKLSPEKVVYISCNPVTQERDLEYLEKQGYVIKEIQPVDMFPQTGHVEAVILMTKCGSGEKK